MMACVRAQVNIMTEGGAMVHLCASFAADDHSADPWSFYIKVIGAHCHCHGLPRTAPTLATSRMVVLTESGTGAVVQSLCYMYTCTPVCETLT